MEEKRVCPSCSKPVASDSPLGLCPECLVKSGFRSGGASESRAGSGTGFSAPAIEHLQQLFPQLEILELIGRGGMGAVYKARQPRLNRFIALKILAREGDADARFGERFQREAQALAQLSHPNIVTVHDFGEEGGLFYLLMEFVDGLNLRQLQRTRKLSPEEALAIVPPICEALQYAHEQGIVHRDIKPENILLDKNGRIKIADFGIAKILGAAPGEPLTGDQQAVGTPHYMAPEQIEKPTTVDHRADIYSLGVVLYEMLTGELPLGRFAAPSQKVQIDVRLDEVVLRALEKAPELRFQRATDIKTQVETITQTPPQWANAPAPANSAPSAAVASPVAPSETSAREGTRAPDAAALFGFSPRAVPRRIWIVVGMLGLEALGNVVSIADSKQAIGWLTFKLLAIAGLLLRWRPVWVLAIIMAAVHVVAFASAAPFVAALNLAVVVLMVSTYRFYSSPPTARTPPQIWAAVALQIILTLIPALNIWPVSLVQLLLLASVFLPKRRPLVTAPAISVSPRDGMHDSSRFSRTAIVGAAWAASAILAAIFAVVLGNEGPPGGEKTLTTLGLALSYTLLPLGITGVFGAPILGVVAISQIRRSAGRLDGLGLAVFDVLCTPLVVLGGVAGWATHLVLTTYKEIYNNLNQELPQLAKIFMRHPMEWSIVAGLAVAMVLGWPLARRVWRAANQPLEPRQRDAAPSQPTAALRAMIWGLPLAALIVAAGVFGGQMIQNRAELNRQIRERREREQKQYVQQAMQQTSGVAATQLSTRADDAEAKTRLAAAESHLLHLAQLLSSGLYDQENFDQAAAEVEVLRAELEGDAKRIARAKLTAAERKLQRTMKLVNTGQAPNEEYEAAMDEFFLRWVKAQSGDSESSTTPTLTFGPWREHVLQSWVADSKGPKAIDLDSAKTYDIAGGETTATIWNNEWVRRNGIDLSVYTQNFGGASDNYYSIKLDDLLLSHKHVTDRWSNLSAEQLVRNIWDLVVPKKDRAPAGDIKYQIEKQTEELPLTYAFKTREGGIGLLQVTGFSTEPRGVKVRYKLVTAQN